MKAYELLYLTAPNIQEKKISNLMDRIESILDGKAGKIEKLDDWGTKKLAYEVNNLQEGNYTLINFNADPNVIAELHRVLRINEAVERHMIVRHTNRDHAICV
ncbi:MAG: 30S ribosomal protein S6 [Eggerthellaceae bacterium]|nr:30S ribosomal protein S6 [Eggerthellaceae bacterium]